MQPGKSTVLNFPLTRVEEEPIEKFTRGNGRYYSNEEIVKFFNDLQAKYPKLAKVHELGNSHENRPIIAIEITQNVDKERESLKPMVKYVANIHGDQKLGRQLLVYFAEYLLVRYINHDDEVIQLVNTTDIYLVPTMNPDSFYHQEVSIDPVFNFIYVTNVDSFINFESYH